MHFVLQFELNCVVVLVEVGPRLLALLCWIQLISRGFILDRGEERASGPYKSPGNEVDSHSISPG